MLTHGGNLHSASRRLGCAPSRIQDASASLIPFPLPWRLRLSSLLTDYSCYPDVTYHNLRDSIGSYHSLPADYILPGNGASELITWAARDAAAIGVSLLPRLRLQTTCVASDSGQRNIPHICILSPL